ncbi:hypothetical protein ACFCV8_22050 [Streptomyces sp. NPDC056347]|uniref:hypothetical protein n=1 Tax=Streptomyces sp. NPDC056347 TaxID=3345790 RepID=UPI0035DBF78D
MTARAKSLTGWVVLLVAAAVCALGGWSYLGARGDDGLAYAKSRDAALADGKDRLARLNSLDAKDARSVDAGLGAWLDSATGPFHDQLRRTRSKDAEELTKAAATARAKVTDAALTALDKRAGTAEMIASVDVEVTPRTGQGGTERKRFEATLARTPDGWKVKALTAIPVGSGT